MAGKIRRGGPRIFRQDGGAYGAPVQGPARQPYPLRGNPRGGRQGQRRETPLARRRRRQGRAIPLRAARRRRLPAARDGAGLCRRAAGPHARRARASEIRETSAAAYLEPRAGAVCKGGQSHHGRPCRRRLAAACGRKPVALARDGKIAGLSARGRKHRPRRAALHASGRRRGCVADPGRAHGGGAGARVALRHAPAPRAEDRRVRGQDRKRLRPARHQRRAAQARDGDAGRTAPHPNPQPNCARRNCPSPPSRR